MIYITYPDKKTEEEIFDVSSCENNVENSCEILNSIIHSENFIAMSCLLKKFNMKSKIDLVYIDPPYATNNVFHIGKRANTISSSKSDSIAYSDNLTGYKYLDFLRNRLILLKHLMSDRSSIYLHIDCKIGHYVKVIMDEIFGVENFRNDITRIKCNPKNFKRNGYGNIKDMILFYTKTDDFIWNEPMLEYTESDKIKLFPKIDKNGMRYTTVPLHAPGETLSGATGKMWKNTFPPKGRHWRVAPEELDVLDSNNLIEWSNNGNPRRIIYESDKQGKRMQDIWEYKDPQYPNYPTEKNMDLINRIVSTSSNEKSIVLDCFAGSGTTAISALRLDRRYIVIDESDKAIEVMVKRLEKSNGKSFFNNDTNYTLLTEKDLCI